LAGREACQTLVAGRSLRLLPAWQGLKTLPGRALRPCQTWQVPAGPARPLVGSLPGAGPGAALGRRPTDLARSGAGGASRSRCQAGRPGAPCPWRVYCQKCSRVLVHVNETRENGFPGRCGLVGRQAMACPVLCGYPFFIYPCPCTARQPKAPLCSHTVLLSIVERCWN